MPLKVQKLMDLPIKLDDELQAALDERSENVFLTDEHRVDRILFPFVLAVGITGWTGLWFCLGWIVRGMWP